jgi:hypothetical protein
VPWPASGLWPNLSSVVYVIPLFAVPFLQLISSQLTAGGGIQFPRNFKILIFTPRWRQHLMVLEEMRMVQFLRLNVVNILRYGMKFVCDWNINSSGVRSTSFLLLHQNMGKETLPVSSPFSVRCSQQAYSKLQPGNRRNTDRFPVQERYLSFLRSVQRGFAARPASYSNNMVVLSPRAKR